MGIITSRPIYKRQPPQAEVIPNPRYQDGLALLWSGTALLPYVAFEHATLNRTFDAQDSSVFPDRQASKSGIGRAVGIGGAKYLKWRQNNADDVGVKISAGSDFSLLVSIDNIGNSSGNPGIFRNNTGSTGTTFFIANGLTRRPWIRWNGTDVLKPSSGSQWDLGVTQTFLLRVRSSAFVDVWWGGQVQHSASHARPTADMSGVNAIFNFGIHGTTEQVTGNYTALAVWDRYISDSEARQLTDNPNNLFKPRRRWVPFSAAAGTTFNQAVAGSITSTGTLTFITSFKQTLAGSITATGTLARKISTSVEGSITATGSILKRTFRDLAGSITSTGILASELSADLLKTVTGSITATGTLTKKVFRSLSGSISSTGSTTKKTSIDLDGSISMSGDPDKGMSQDTSGSITPTGNLTASDPFVPAPDDGVGGPGPDGSLAQRIRRVYGYFKRDGR